MVWTNRLFWDPTVPRILETFRGIRRARRSALDVIEQTGRYNISRHMLVEIIDADALNAARHTIDGLMNADVMVENLTVHEMLLYTAELKCSRELSFASKRRRVLMLTNSLGLDTCRNNKIATSNRRCISGNGLPPRLFCASGSKSSF